MILWIITRIINFILIEFAPYGYKKMPVPIKERAFSFKIKASLLYEILPIDARRKIESTTY